MTDKPSLSNFGTLIWSDDPDIEKFTLAIVLSNDHKLIALKNLGKHPEWKSFDDLPPETLITDDEIMRLVRIAREVSGG